MSGAGWCGGMDDYSMEPRAAAAPSHLDTSALTSMD